VPSRHSQSKSSVDTDITSNEHDDLSASAEATLDYWHLVHNISSRMPIPITSAAELQLDADPYVVYATTLPLVGPSDRPIFVEGAEKFEERRVAQILAKLNADEANHNVLILIAGMDNCITRNRSIVNLVERFPNIRFHLTFVMPSEKVQDLPCFQKRTRLEDPTAFSWAHFDLTEFAELANKFWDGDVDALWSHGKICTGCLFHIFELNGEPKSRQKVRQRPPCSPFVNWQPLYDPLSHKLSINIGRDSFEFQFYTK
jgi:hypothetical protein